MSNQQSQLRTADLSEEVYSTLASTGDYDYFKTIEELPTALSTDELSFLGSEAFGRGLLGPKGDYDKGKYAKTTLLWNVGITAIKSGDLVTAENTTSVLKDSHSFLNWIALKRALRIAKKRVTEDILETS